jgi:hypothetical protein
MATRPLRVFTAFDYDHDEPLRNLLMGQSKHPGSPFEMHDWSVKDPFTGDWQAKVRAKMRAVDQVIVLCGQYTHTAVGVATELTIAREEKKPYFLLAGYADRACTRPVSAAPGDKMYTWTWDNIRALLAGSR